MDAHPRGRSRSAWAIFVVLLLTGYSAGAASLTGSFALIQSGTAVDLTVEGPVDWVHWGLYTPTSLNRKAGVTPLINNFTRLLASVSNSYNFIYQFADNYNGYSWSDGTPTASITNTTTGVWAYGGSAAGTGFQITVPADNTERVLKLYVGAYAASGKFEAFLSDQSATPYTDTSLTNAGNGESAVYSISYAAQSAGQMLTIKWTLLQGYRGDANVTLQAAALSVPGANIPPILTIASPGDNATFSAGSDISLTANAADPDGSVARVEFFAGSNRIGQATNSPFTVTWTNVPAGDYALTAMATDDGGASRVSAPVEVFVSGTGGWLSAAAAYQQGTEVNLTTEGTSDWAHWGLSSANSFNHKSGVVQ